MVEEFQLICNEKKDIWSYIIADFVDSGISPGIEPAVIGTSPGIEPAAIRYGSIPGAVPESVKSGVVINSSREIR